MLGIEDGWVVLAYLLCVGSTLLCVIYGFATWNRGEEPLKQEDVDWAKEEKEEVEEAL
ncbi:MAG: symporter small accessory protein [Planctomycetota bacterium]